MKPFARCLALTIAILTAVPALGLELAVEPQGAQLSGKFLRLQVTASGLAEGETATARLLVDGQEVAGPEGVVLSPGQQTVRLPQAQLETGKRTIALVADGARAEVEVRVIPAWLSIVPPLIAIVLALLFKDVLIALFCGVFVGALILYGWNPITAFARVGDTFVVPALADTSHVQIIVFSTLLGGMVGVISKSGGSHGIVRWLSPYATTARRGQIATWFMGLLVFFDDYANSLIVGNTMRPITDRLKISREKLAYIVDSTAAPVASLIPISTWVGFEVGLIAGAFESLGLPYNAYGTFVASIPFRFYSIFALSLGLTVALSRKDLGPMLKAERRAFHEGAVIAEGDTPLADYTKGGLMPREETPKRAVNAFAPILTVIGITLLGLFTTGAGALAAEGKSRADYPTFLRWIQDVFSNADSYNTLVWASLAGLFVAIALPLAQRIMPIKEAMEGMLEGYKAMLLAIIVLILAWSVAAVCEELQTANYIVDLTENVLSPRWLPALVFLISAGVAFSTGSSWGTMAILMPLVLSLAHGLNQSAGFAPDSSTYYTLLLGSISSVLAGSVWGDHCSPISDTTILSSMATGCDHIAHVKTQLPYAMTLGFLGILIGDIPTAYGLPVWVSLVVGISVVVGGMLWLGKRVEAPPAS